MLFRKIPQENSMSIKTNGLAKSMYEPPSPPFLNKLLKPNTKHVLGGPPTSLGHLLILPKEKSYNKCYFRRRGVEMYEKCPASPPQYTFLGCGICNHSHVLTKVTKDSNIVRTWIQTTLCTTVTRLQKCVSFEITKWEPSTKYVRKCWEHVKSSFQWTHPANSCLHGTSNTLSFKALGSCFSLSQTHR